MREGIKLAVAIVLEGGYLRQTTTLYFGVSKLTLQNCVMKKKTE